MGINKNVLASIAIVLCLATATISASQFSIRNGQIIDPTGKVHIPLGINVNDESMPSAATNMQAQPLTTFFPGINHVRLNAYPTSGDGTQWAAYPAPSHYLQFVQYVTGWTLSGSTWTNQRSGSNIVVEFEDHVSNGGQINGSPAPPLTGAALQTEVNWYASMASYYKGNPWVWFGTMNEPGCNSYNLNDIAAISTQQVAIYNAIRNTGSMAVLQCMAGCGGGNVGTVGIHGGFPQSDYSGMTNIVWELHAYYSDWDSMGGNCGTVYSDITTGLKGQTQTCGYYGGYGYTAAQTITSADGVVPVIFGEWGSNSGNPNDQSANQITQAMKALVSQGIGSTAWAWSPDGGGTPAGVWVMMNNGVWGGTLSLTSWGQLAAGYIKAAAPTAAAATPISSQSAPVSGSSTNYYMGCFVDSANRALNGPSTWSASMNNDMCRHFCGVRGYAYAGTEVGYECYCGNSAGSQGSASASDCSVACAGNSGQMCGGGWRNSVYKSDYLGCFIDGHSGADGVRDLSTYITEGSSTTVETCMTSCSNGGYKYAGLQNGNQCFCSNSYGSQGTASSSDCNKPCAGNSGEICGGGWRNSIYQVHPLQ